MKPATRVFFMVVAVQRKAMLDEQRRILSAFEKWLESQDETRESTTPERSESLRALQ